MPGQVRLIEDDTEAVLAVASGVEPEDGPHVPGVQCFEIRSQASVKRKGEGWAGPEARRPNLRGGSSSNHFGLRGANAFRSAAGLFQTQNFTAQKKIHKKDWGGYE